MVGDRVVAGMNLNVRDVPTTSSAFIRERVAVDDRQLADPEVPLGELVPRQPLMRRPSAGAPTRSRYA